MCEAVEAHDSRGGGWYCCRCNTWNEGECSGGTCRVCAMHHRAHRREDAAAPAPSTSAVK